MNYYFNVSDQILTCTNTRRTIISDSVNVHIAKFKFDSMWNGFGKTATFTNSKTGISVNKVIDLDQCVIPYEVLVATQEGGNLVVCVTGVKDDVTFPTKMDMNYPLLIGLSSPHSGVPTQPPTQSVYDQIMTILGGLQINTAPISDLDTNNDEKLATIGQLKEYINNRLV